jgi:hypothetical protein
LDTINCNDVIDNALGGGNASLAKLFSSDVLFIKAPMTQPVDDAVKDEIEEIKSLRGTKRRKLTVLLETNGGFVETVERLVSVFRKHYEVVEYVVPNYAYSAGTILVLSGDEIYMDYYSVLGPIDPQMESSDGLMPGMGYLAKFQELLDVINKPGVDPATTRGELAFLINKFDAAKLFWIEQATEHSKALLREWLPKYKFKSWAVKETSGAPVSDADRQQRADEIAKALGDASKWHSHGRGLTIRELESEDIKLKIENYSDNKELYGNISHYRGLFVDYMARRGFRAALHSRRGIRRLA